MSRAKKGKSKKNNKNRWENVLANVETLVATRKLTSRIIFWLIFIVVFVASLIFSIMYFVEQMWHLTEDSSQYLWVFAVVSLGVGIIVGTVLSLIYSRAIKKITKPYIDAIERVKNGDYSVSVEDGLLLQNSNMAQSFNNMIRRLASVETLHENFISDFSHEFKTPIVSISGFAKLLKDPNLTEEERNEYLDVIISESERLVSLSQSVLMLTRLDDQVVEKAPFLLDEQLRQSVLLFDKALKERDISVDLDAPTISICSSQKLLSQVWVNLLNNAIKFSPNGTEVKITAKTEGNFAVVTVADNGCGMDEQTMQNIFDKFFQGDKSRSVEGNGLGLAIVKKIMKLVSGEITVQSKVGVGSVFTVKLPLEQKGKK